MDPLNEALVKSVHAVANQRLKAAVNAIKAAANQKNATIAQRNAAIANLEKRLQEAGQAAKAANVVAPNIPAAPSTIQATNAVSALVNRIVRWEPASNGTFNANKIRQGNLYSQGTKNNKNKINKAIIQYSNRSFRSVN